jgi:hypothetical protein
MRLLVEIGYNKVLLPKDCDYSAIIDAIGRGEIVEETGPYGQRVYQCQDGQTVTITLINDDDVRLPNVARPPELEKLLEIAKEKEDLKIQLYEANQKLKKFEALATPAKE